MYDLSKEAFFSTRWRWERALEISSGRMNLSEQDDRRTRRAVKYLNRYQTRPKSAANLYSDIYMAHRFYMQPYGTRWFVEAAVMAGQSTQEIAKRWGLENNVIARYEDYFFSARPMLKNPGYAEACILGPALAVGECGVGYDFFWKLLGYSYGWDVLTQYWKNGIMPEDVKDTLKDTLQTKVLMDGLLAANTRKINQFNSTDVVDQSLRVALEEPDKVKVGEEKEKLQDSLSELIDSITLQPAPMIPRESALEPRFKHQVASITEQPVEEKE